MSEAEHHEAGIERRSIIGSIGKGALGMAAMGAMAAGGIVASSQPAEAQTIGDPDILNFALNLEYLEAEFYLRAYFGTGLSDVDVTGTSTAGGVTGGSAVPFVSSAIQSYCQRLASDELTHVRFLRAALGSAAVARPTIDLSASFTNLAIAAGLITAGQTFNPFADDVSFLLGAYIFEDVGVSAYAGAARLISNKDYLEAAAGILAVEAYHAGSIRTLLANIGAGVAANAISVARAAVSGGNNDQGIIVPGNSYNAVSADSNSLAFRRTTSQVLSIVYIGQAGGGGFFPSKTNGTIS